jgi:TrmH family RNA methyltransferase
MNINKFISSSSNPQIKKLVQYLKKAKTRKEDGVFVCEGQKMFLEILNQFPEKIIKCYLTKSAYDGLSDDEKHKLMKIDGDLVDDKVFSQMAETVSPQGFMAIVEMPKYSLPELLGTGKIKLLILDDLRDPGNMGTIIRTAEAAGVTGILMSKETVDVTNPKVVRSTMGALLRVPLMYADNLKEEISKIREQKPDFKLYVSALKASISYKTACYQGDYGIVVGNEANGVSEEIINQADQCLIIPMAGKVESLNAAIAAALLMYADN